MTITIDTKSLEVTLTKAFDNFIEAFSAFKDSEVNTAIEKGNWTPTQVVKHILLATDGLPDASTKPSERPVDALLPMIRPWWEDMSQKFQSPEPLRPDNNPATRDELLAELYRVKQNDLAMIVEKDLSALCLDMELPSVGYLTRFEWLWFIEMHLNRHTFQLRNLRKSTKSL